MEDTSNKEFSLGDIFLSLQKWAKYLQSKWKIIFMYAALGAVIGSTISLFSKPKFVAESNIVLESGSIQAAGLGAAFGLGGESSTGLFSSVNNILWLYKSNNMLSKALLSEVNFEGGRHALLIEEFRRTSKEVQKRVKKNPDWSNIMFNKDDSLFNRKQASYLKMCVSVIKNEYLEINPVEKTDNVINVKVTAEDELFAFQFAEEIVKIVNDFYIETKTQKSLLNVKRLSNKADSMERTMNVSMISTASSVDRTPYANPNLSVLRVEAQKGNIDVQANTAMYLQVIQNLEAAKIELAKETPIIEIVDEPILPLAKNKLSLIIASGVGLILGLFLSLGCIIILKLYRDAVKMVA